MKTQKLMLILCFAVVPLCVHAQAQKSELDTLSVGDASHHATGTIRVPVLMRNTFAVSGISFRVSYDPSRLVLTGVDTVGSRVSGVYNEIASTKEQSEGWVFWMGLNMDDPFNNYVPPGSGPIAHLVFRLKDYTDSVDERKRFPVWFEENVKSGHYNALSTKGGQLVFPVLREGNLQLSKPPTAAQGAETELKLPEAHFLADCTPNPFESTTGIPFACPASKNGPDHVALRIYDNSGRLVHTIVDEEAAPGWHFAEWNAESASGRRVPAGVYFCRMEVNTRTVGIKKLVLLK